MKKKLETHVWDYYSIQQTFKIMKIFLFISILSIGQLLAIESYSQRAKLSLDFNNSELVRVLDEIENQTEFYFLFNENLIDVKRKVDVNIDDKGITETLDELFENSAVSYQIVDRKIVLVPGEQNLSQGQRAIQGTVIDSSGEPLPGVSIMIKGSTLGTITDFDGNFNLANIDSGTTLIFSFVGMRSQEIVIAGQSTLNITMEESSIGIDEVVAVGYGSVKRSDLTGAVSSLSSKVFEQQPVTSVSEALQGRVSGVSIASPSGKPGGSQIIRIRGANSINASNAPLIVVDGIFGIDFNSLNPNNIKSIEVLKDASATAIYGSRGANGVILVTTKKGKKGKAQITFDYFTRMQEVPRKVDILDGEAYATSVNNRRRYAKYSQRLNDLTDYNYPTEEQMLTPDANGNRSMTWLYYHPETIDAIRSGELEVDWQDEIFRRGQMNNYNLSIRGASETISYSVSGNYLNQEGLVINSKYEKLNLRTSIDVQASDRLKIGATGLSVREKDNPVLEGGGGVVDRALYALPVALGVKYPDNFSDSQFPFSESLVGRYFNHKGSYGGFGDSSPNGGGLRNPVALAMEPEREVLTIRNTLSSYLDYKIADGLTLKVIGGAMFTNRSNRDYYNELFSGSTYNDGVRSGSIGNFESSFWQNSNILTYQKKFDRHSLTATGLFEQQYTTVSSSSITVEGFNSNTTGVNAIESAKSVTGKSSYKEERVILSYMGRLIYGFDDRLLVTASLRTDGSSVFGANNKWGVFPSGAVAWKLTNEEFIKNSKSIDKLKVRSSYGVTGNQAIGPYQTLSQLTTGGSALDYPTNGGALSIGSAFVKIANPDLKWETTAQFDFGADISLFEHRLNITADYYFKKTTDLLSSRSLASQSGFSSVLQNVGDVENKGFEFVADGTLIQKDDFRWTAGLNVTFNKNKVVNLTTPDEERIALNEVMYLMKGQPLGAIYGYEYLGVWKDGEEAEAYKYGQIAGTAKIVDQNNDGVYDEKDKVFLGSANPDVVWGFNTSANYKGLSLNLQFQGVFGNEIYNAGAKSHFDMEDVGATGYRGKERWHPINHPDGFYSRVDYSGTINQTDARQNAQNVFTRKDAWLSDIFVEDGSFVRLSNVTLAYDLKKSIVHKLGIEAARIYVSGQNLYVWTDYTGYDPELAASENDAIRGYEYNGYPKARTYTLGVKVDF